ncbi:MAG: hypothetical protein WC441_02290 [Patescibacteria group bacterium]
MPENLKLKVESVLPNSGSSPEKLANPEKINEQVSPKVERPDKEVQSTRSANPARNIVAQTNVQSLSQQRAMEIDRILADGLEDIFIALPPQEQQRFKVKGEETVAKINKLLDSAKFKIKQIVSLIRRWLSTLPGVNRYFLEQEAKIKADRIMRIKK